MKQLGETTRIYYRLAYGDPPRPDDVLRTTTGRCYLVRRVTKGRTRYRLTCTIVPPNVETPGNWYTLRWDTRSKGRTRCRT